MIDIDGETETMYWYHYDGLGSVVALSDSSGSIVEAYSYDVFGAVKVHTVAAPSTFDSSQFDIHYASCAFSRQIICENLRHLRINHFGCGYAAPGNMW